MTRLSKKREMKAKFNAIKDLAFSKSETPFDGIREPLKRAYLIAYSLTGVKTRASELAGVSLATPYTKQWTHDPAFIEGLEIAEHMITALYEDEIHRRAVEGVEKPVGWYKGEAGGVVREYSDILLMFRAKALAPHKYRDHMELRGSLGQIDIRQLTDEQIRRIGNGEHPLAVLADREPTAQIPASTGEIVVDESSDTVAENGADDKRSLT